MNEESDNEVRRRAYEIWQAEGEPQGEELRHWFQASEEMGKKGEETTPPQDGETAATVDSDPNSAIKKERAKEREGEQGSSVNNGAPKQAAE
ncbi:MAG: DUF2934 domain-containing protein [Rhizobiaceae bacterium]|nr:DUF2934 domain-containing protein [Rhizobiaceae bacterium]